MKRASLRARLGGVAGAIVLVAGLSAAVGAGPAGAKAVNASPSDPTRADYHTGNVVTCAQAGFPDSTGFAFASGTGSIDNGDVSGEVVGGTTVNVFVPDPSITIDAVVVKGGPAYNVYSTSSGSDAGNHVPPAEPQLTEYISPFNGGSNIPTVSHWFICYSGGETPPVTPGTGSLVVAKVATNVATGVTPPATITLHVECDDIAGTTADIVLPGAGGTSDPITGIDEGTDCIVTETTSITGVTPTYDPVDPADSTQGLAVIAKDSTVTVTVTNGFSEVAGVVVVTTPAPAPAAAAAAVAVTPAFTG